MASTILPLVLAMLFASNAALAFNPFTSDESDFQSCFCWDKDAEDFCGGSDWYNSDSCRQWVIHELWWAPVAIVFMLILILFPCCFYAARCCCNCCGGRHATTGCCCSDKESRATFPGYSKRSIVVAKSFFTIVFITTIYFTVRVYQENSKLHTDFIATTYSVGDSVTHLQSMVVDSAEAAQYLALQHHAGSFSPALAPASLARETNNIIGQINDKVSNIQSILSKVRNGESNQVYGRNHLVISVPSYGLLVLLIAFVFMLLSFRRTMGVCMVLLVIEAIGMVAIAVPSGILSEAVETVCDNYDSTLVPILVGLAKKGGGCENDNIADGIAKASTAFSNFVTEPTSQFCQNFQVACEQVKCGSTTCSNGASFNPPATVVQSAEGVAQIAEVASTLMTPGSTGQSISDLALASGDAAQQAAAKMMAFYTTDAPKVTLILSNLQSINTNCQSLRDALDGDVFLNLCGSATNLRSLQVVRQTVYVIVCHLVAIVAVIFGMKRFRNFNDSRGARVPELEPCLQDRLEENMYDPGNVNGFGYRSARILEEQAITGLVVEPDPLPADHGVATNSSRQPQGYGSTSDVGSPRVI